MQQNSSSVQQNWAISNPGGVQQYLSFEQQPSFPTPQQWVPSAQQVSVSFNEPQHFTGNGILPPQLEPVSPHAASRGAIGRCTKSFECASPTWNNRTIRSVRPMKSNLFIIYSDVIEIKQMFNSLACHAKTWALIYLSTVIAWTVRDRREQGSSVDRDARLS